ncbi:MAG TPA: ABC transporter permease [Candidatus Sulfotelmatobacter sp.]|nr:ABC transporter permease [Candidatus Sulfotelmatobacter sp.]
MSESWLQQIPTSIEDRHVSVVASLYFLGGVSHPFSKDSQEVVVVGSSGTDCVAGSRLAERIHAKVQDELWVGYWASDHGQKQTCRLSAIESTGGPEDDRISIPLVSAQRLAGLLGRVSLIQISVPGTPAEIQNYISNLQNKLPDLDVHGIRQFTEAEGKIYERISGLLSATVVVVLVLTMLCVMAAMTNVAMERKNDVGLMKAIGGATRRVLRLFLAEAATLGLIAGIIGAAAGLALSVALGKAVFGVAAHPRLIVYPIVVALTIVVAVAGAYPLRRLAGIRPASVFRGEA